jgi:hypothetical protein
MKTGSKCLVFLGFLIVLTPPFHAHAPQEKEKLTVINPFRTDAHAAILEVSPFPKFTFFLNTTLRIRKTNKAEMYEYNPKKPSKPYQHLALFLELLERETKTKPPKVDIMAVTTKEYLNVVEIVGLVWIQPLAEESAKPKSSGLVWHTGDSTFKAFMANFKEPSRVLILEQFLAHLMLLMEWEASVRKVSQEDTEILVDKRQEEWKKREGKAYSLFHRIAGNWKLLKLDWPPAPPQRPKVLSIPLPWPPWPRSSPGSR